MSTLKKSEAKNAQTIKKHLNKKKDDIDLTINLNIKRGSKNLLKNSGFEHKNSFIDLPNNIFFLKRKKRDSKIQKSDTEIFKNVYKINLNKRKTTINPTINPVKFRAVSQNIKSIISCYKELSGRCKKKSKLQSCINVSRKNLDERKQIGEKIYKGMQKNTYSLQSGNSSEVKTKSVIQNNEKIYTTNERAEAGDRPNDDTSTIKRENDVNTNSLQISNAILDESPIFSFKVPKEDEISKVDEKYMQSILELTKCNTGSNSLTDKKDYKYEVNIKTEENDTKKINKKVRTNRMDVKKFAVPKVLQEQELREAINTDFTVNLKCETDSVSNNDCKDLNKPISDDEKIVLELKKEEELRKTSKVKRRSETKRRNKYKNSPQDSGLKELWKRKFSDSSLSSQYSEKEGYTDCSYKYLNTSSCETLNKNAEGRDNDNHKNLTVNVEKQLENKDKQNKTNMNQEEKIICEKEINNEIKVKNELLNIKGNNEKKIDNKPIILKELSCTNLKLPPCEDTIKVLKIKEAKINKAEHKNVVNLFPAIKAQEKSIENINSTQMTEITKKSAIKKPVNEIPNWSILNRLEKAFLALGTPNFSQSNKNENFNFSKSNEKILKSFGKTNNRNKNENYSSSIILKEAVRTVPLLNHRTLTLQSDRTNNLKHLRKKSIKLKEVESEKIQTVNCKDGKSPFRAKHPQKIVTKSQERSSTLDNKKNLEQNDWANKSKSDKVFKKQSIGCENKTPKKQKKVQNEKNTDKDEEHRSNVKPLSGVTTFNLKPIKKLQNVSPNKAFLKKKNNYNSTILYKNIDEWKSESFQKNKIKHQSDECYNDSEQHVAATVISSKGSFTKTSQNNKSEIKKPSTVPEKGYDARQERSRQFKPTKVKTRTLISKQENKVVRSRGKDKSENVRFAMLKCNFENLSDRNPDVEKNLKSSTVTKNRLSNNCHTFCQRFQKPKAEVFPSKIPSLHLRNSIDERISTEQDQSKTGDSDDINLNVSTATITLNPEYNPDFSTTTFKVIDPHEKIKNFIREHDWEQNMQLYREIVKDIIDQYERTNLLKQCQAFKEQKGVLPTDQNFLNETCSIKEYRKKIISEYKSHPVCEYKRKIIEKMMDKEKDQAGFVKRRSLTVVTDFPTREDLDVKDLHMNIKRVLDSRLYVDTENLERLRSYEKGILPY